MGRPVKGNLDWRVFAGLMLSVACLYAGQEPIRTFSVDKEVTASLAARVHWPRRLGANEAFFVRSLTRDQLILPEAKPSWSGYRLSVCANARGVLALKRNPLR